VVARSIATIHVVATEHVNENAYNPAWVAPSLSNFHIFIGIIQATCTQTIIMNGMH